LQSLDQHADSLNDEGWQSVFGPLRARQNNNCRQDVADALGAMRASPEAPPA
jgi:hypothetical protein